jgi:hypothetical protein
MVMETRGYPPSTLLATTREGVTAKTKGKGKERTEGGMQRLSEVWPYGHRYLVCKVWLNPPKPWLALSLLKSQ